jgi:predicted PurR-regulated permease PerM
MTLQRQFSFWGIAFLALIGALWLFSDILLPFLAGLALAYFLDPVADSLERAGFTRLVATFIILLCSLLLIIVILFLALPILADQITKLAVNLPSLISNFVQLFDKWAPDWLKDALAGSGTDVSGWLRDNAGRAAQWVGTVLTSVWSGGLAVVNVLSLLIVTPIVAFYLLNDWDRMIAIVDDCLPRQHLETIRALARQIDDAMAGFIRGQGTVCLTLGLFYAIALSVLGLNFGFLIGLAAGALSFIPYVGAIIGGVAAVGMALVQFWPEPMPILLVAGAFALGQFLEGNFLSPRLVGERVGLHPVWLMFALFAFGYLFGFVGLLMAVPLAAAAGVIIRFGVSQYRKSPLYLGTIPKVHDFPVPNPDTDTKSTS